MGLSADVDRTTPHVIIRRGPGPNGWPGLSSDPFPGGGPCSAASGESWSAEQKNNLAAVPGLTGIWRLAHLSRASAEDAVRWEQNYAANMSFMSDLKVIGQTIIAMLGFRR